MTAQTTEAPAPVVLPRVPSRLIRIALEDLEAAEKVPTLLIAMDDEWHTPQDDGVCVICLAGATMRQRLGVADDEHVIPGYSADNESVRLNGPQLRTLNDLRLGFVYLAFAILGVEWPKSGVDARAVITPYRRSPSAFKADMRRLASDLEAAGY